MNYLLRGFSHALKANCGTVSEEKSTITSPYPFCSSFTNPSPVRRCIISKVKLVLALN
jgi:hypothetical protein